MISSNVSLASMTDIASWQINGIGTQNVKVSMPAIQRGYIWSSTQVEGLWDSLIRQLPIGSFIVTPYRKELVNTNLQNNLNNESLLLLDGQQRATSIALAFSNPWNYEKQTYPMALWIDITAPEGDYIDRSFMFRLITSAHPWGYSRKHAERLSSKERNNARQAFQNCYRRAKKLTEKDKLPQCVEYPGFDIAFSWPWDSYTPVPFALLFEACRHEDWKKYLKDYVNGFKYWLSPMPTLKTACWKKKLFDALDNSNCEEFDRINMLVECIKRMDSSTKIPLISIPEIDINLKLSEIKNKYSKLDSSENNAQVPPEAIESLFIRINSGGTPLNGEELVYSIFKSIYPNAEIFVEELGKEAFLRPSRLVALSTRLALSLYQDKVFNESTNRDSQDILNGSMPPAMTVTRFRSLIYENKDYKNVLESFMLNKARELFLASRDLIAGKPSNEGRFIANPDDYHTGSILFENIARTHQDLYFFILRWLYDNGSNCSNTISKHIIGALTSISFFSTDVDKFVRRIWRLRNRSWWQKGVICTKNIMKMDDDKIIMPPLPKPDELDKCLQVKFGNSFEIKNWDWYETFAKEYPKAANSDYARFCKNCLDSENKLANIDEDDLRLVDHVWYIFWEKIWDNKQLVLYAQRYWLDMFYPGYNPAAIDQQEDSDRPYDWDHIFPQGYLSKNPNMYKIWKDWPYSIANLRAWPLELNRSDGMVSPSDKISYTKLTEKWSNLLPESNSISEASFIEQQDWEEISTDDKTRSELRKNRTDFGNKLLYALWHRMSLLYRNWYETLEVDKIFSD